MLHPHHLDELLKGSGISEALVNRNFQSIDDPGEIDQFLNRNTDKRWKHWQHGPGWGVSGVDPQTGESTLLGAQFKPDTPVQRYENGRPKLKREGSPDLQKYFSASGYESEPLFLDTGDPDYWPKVIADRSQPRVITEGAKKAGCLLTLGEAAISLPGVANGQKLGELKGKLKPFCKVGSKVYLAFDSDYRTNLSVYRALETLGKLISAEGAIVRILAWDEKYKGIDDYLTSFPPEKRAEAFAELLDQSISFERWRKEAKPEPQPVEEEEEPLVTAEELLNLSQQFLDPYKLFDGDLPALLESRAKAMPTRVEMLITTLLPAIASRIGTKSKVIIKRSAGYTQPAIIWSLVIAPTGSLKTPTQMAILAPLWEVEGMEARRYRDDQDIYKAQFKATKGKKDAEPPSEPVPRQRFVTTDSTPEALARILDESKPDGLLIYRDELAGEFKSYNKYRPNGKGDDTEFHLSLWNGSGAVKDRASGSIFIPESAISRTGSIQADILRLLMTDEWDANGHLARWLVCAPDCPPGYLNLDDEDSDLDSGLEDCLSVLYGRLGNLPVQDYCLSPGAKKLFQQAQHRLTDLAREECHPGIAAIYPKIISYVARFALILHLANSILRGEKPQPAIPHKEMRRAVDLAGYYLGQAKLLYLANGTGSQEESIFKIVQLARRKNRPIGARDVKQGVRELHDVASERIRDLLIRAAKSGHGEVEGEGKKLKFTAVPLVNPSTMSNEGGETDSEQDFESDSPTVNTASTSCQPVNNVDNKPPGRNPTSEHPDQFVDNNVDVFVDNWTTPVNEMPEGFQKFVDNVDVVDRKFKSDDLGSRPHPSEYLSVPVPVFEEDMPPW